MHPGRAFPGRSCVGRALDRLFSCVAKRPLLFRLIQGPFPGHFRTTATLPKTPLLNFGSRPQSTLFRQGLGARRKFTICGSFSRSKIGESRPIVRYISYGPFLENRSGSMI